MNPTNCMTKICEKLQREGKEITLENFFKDIKQNNPSDTQKKVWLIDMALWKLKNGVT